MSHTTIARGTLVQRLVDPGVGTNADRWFGIVASVTERRAYPGAPTTQPFAHIETAWWFDVDGVRHDVHPGTVHVGLLRVV